MTTKHTFNLMSTHWQILPNNTALLHHSVPLNMVCIWYRSAHTYTYKNHFHSHFSGEPWYLLVVLILKLQSSLYQRPHGTGWHSSYSHGTSAVPCPVTLSQGVLKTNVFTGRCHLKHCCQSSEAVGQTSISRYNGNYGKTSHTIDLQRSKWQNNSSKL